MTDRVTDEEVLAVEQLRAIKDAHSPMLWDEISAVVTELIASRKQLAAAEERCFKEGFNAAIVDKELCLDTSADSAWAEWKPKYDTDRKEAKP